MKTPGERSMERKAGKIQKEPGGRNALGKHAEDIGAAWLASRGMRIIERNYRCPIGEIDLIGQINGTLVIVEIRSRRSESWGTPAESVTIRKRQKLRKVAAWYLSQHGKTDEACRFDVLGILFDEKGSARKVEWIPDAF